MAQIFQVVWETVKVIAGSILFLVIVGVILLMLLVIREAGWYIRQQNKKEIGRTAGGRKEMKAEFFHAVCPLEIGDTVAIKLDNKAQQTEAMPEALYIPPHATVLVGGKDIHIATVTDIATMHYLKSGKTQFLYELDGKGSYKPMKVTMPVQMFDKELKKRGR